VPPCRKIAKNHTLLEALRTSFSSKDSKPKKFSPPCFRRSGNDLLLMFGSFQVVAQQVIPVELDEWIEVQQGLEAGSGHHAQSNEIDPGIWFGHAPNQNSQGPEKTTRNKDRRNPPTSVFDFSGKSQASLTFAVERPAAENTNAQPISWTSPPKAGCTSGRGQNSCAPTTRKFNARTTAIVDQLS